MIKRFDSRQHSLQEIVQRQSNETKNVVTETQAILEAVQREGDQALREYTKRFDGHLLTELAYPPAKIAAAIDEISPELAAVLAQAKENISTFHQRQVQQGFIQSQPGQVMGQQIIPLNRVGVYVPGGTAAYPSTVLMTVLPALIAGVEEIVMVTPANEKGEIAAAVLAAAHLAGITELYPIGGAQAIAALAYGTESIRPVDKIVGPGNIYVATAKKLVNGLVGIDTIAGPSDVLIVADQTANPHWIAADLLAQAEHDVDAQAILITPEADLIERVAAALDKQVAALPRRRIAESSLAVHGKLILVRDLNEAMTIANQIAPEHLELAVADPFALLGVVRNAGSTFLGHHTPEVLGDYLAGPNHTLPTEGTARFSSGLSVQDFVKRCSYLYFSPEAAKDARDSVIQFAEAEGLDGHARSMAIREETKF
ncbi:histidinol dehydrogenase [Enterococcus sp. 8G7_MSG3316]|uniref:Histidinol dehydrogenase n=1 Tax=Candidatus Enterococcus testudinis TaxID=1834191 RepID=A0A242A565_9ENTE|nr:histidinol dehydrogenase [Enterococcus sp. 8G7_MSG3316]